MLKFKTFVTKTLAMIKIAGVKSNDKINFKEFVDFFYKADWTVDLIKLKYILNAFLYERLFYSS